MGDLMPRKGRETELILKELENLSIGDQAKIKSPDYVYDVVTGKKREVDVSVRFKLGTHEFLTIIECRNRKQPEDVTWIEQLVTKTKNLQAHKVIAVSTSGFTDGAKKLAERENVVLRLLKEFEADELIQWTNQVKVTLNDCYKKFRTCNIELFEEKLKDKSSAKNANKILLNDFNPDEKIFKVVATGEYVSLDDIINSMNYENDDFLFNDLNDGDSPVIRNIRLEFDPNNRVVLDISNKDFYIKSIETELYCWIKTNNIPLSNTLRYEENNLPLLDKIDYKFVTGDEKEVIMALARDHKTGDGILNAYYINQKNK